LDGGSRISDLKYKLMTIELLNLAKNYYTYRELSQVIGLPDTVLSRYVKGHVLPAMDRALYINKTLQKIMRLEAEIQLRIRFDDSGYFDNTRLISDTLLLERAVQHAVNRFAGTRITKILSPAVDGVPLATILAHRLGVNLVIAKNTREVGVSAFFEEIYVPGRSGMVLSLYVPRDALRRGDCVLIVDDVLDTGETQMALARIVQKAKAEVTGVYALIGPSTDGETKIEQALHCPVEIVHHIGEKPVQRV
jgi:adenine/guanine phosphoribosyltransferase-like PRPP-binding protein